MSLFALLATRYRVLLGAGLALTLLLGAMSLGWVVQGWRLGEALAACGQAQARTLASLHNTAARETRRASDQRVALEQQLHASSQTQHRRLTDAEEKAARLRDRLATAELRLSVLSAIPGLAGADQHVKLPAAAAARRLVDGTQRTDIDRGAAQRVVDITQRGDRAIIALGMCQDYVQAISEARQ